MGKILRRTFLIGSVAVAGGVAFGYYKVTRQYPNPLLRDLSQDSAALTPYVKIDQSGVTIIVPRAEMGQGVRTTLAAFVAEELDVDLYAITVEHGPASKAYYNSVGMEEAANKPATDTSPGAERMRAATRIASKLLAIQNTGGSTSVKDGYERMRRAGAAARHALVAAAAEKTGIAAAELKTQDGAVITPAGEQIRYEDLAVPARAVKLPKDPDLKPQSAWRYLGKSLSRIDMLPKSTGTAEFAIDVRRPGMIYATVRTNPNIGAPMIRYEAGTALKRRDVDKVIPLPDNSGVAVIGRNSWAAFKGAEDVEIVWGNASYPSSTNDMVAGVVAAFDDRPDSTLRDEGAVDEALASAQNPVSYQYTVPYLAHATMEPMSAVAHLQNGRLDVWTGTQGPTNCQKIAADVCGLGTENIHIHTTYLGGGFGRRGETDFVMQAVYLAQKLEGIPVKLTWSREEDTQHDFYRPLSVAKVRGVVEDGKITAFDLHVAGSAPALDGFARRGIDMNIADPTIVQNAWETPYAISSYRVTGYKAKTMLPVGFWRSVGASQNAFFQESAIDEMAHAGGVDPLELRLRMIDHPPSRKVLEAVGEMSDWGSVLPAGKARGVAFYLSFGVPTAEVVEISRTPDGIRLDKIHAAVDVGTALDPRNIEAQVQGAIIYGLSAAMMGEITVSDGAVEQSNFHDYPALRNGQSPDFEVKILENMPKITGIGEPGLPPVAPALANAIFALTGDRIRDLPMNRVVTFA